MQHERIGKFFRFFQNRNYFHTAHSCKYRNIAVNDTVKIINVRKGRRSIPIDKNITVAIMGCAVNGPGEAREADLGIAGGDGCGLVFSRGQIIRKVAEEQLLDALYEEILKFGE